jgi:hypothetical protein
MPNKRKLSMGLAGVVMLCGISVETLFTGDLERALEYRQGAMNVLSWNL